MKKYHYFSTVFLVSALGLSLTAPDAAADPRHHGYHHRHHHMHRGERIYVAPAPIIHRRYDNYCGRMLDRLEDLRDRRHHLIQRVRRGHDSYDTHRHIQAIQSEIRHVKRRLYEAGC